jgi:type VI secretion system protein ImpK
MQSALSIKPSVMVKRSRVRTGTDLISLATPVLEVIMQLKAGLVAPSNDLRPTFAELLSEMEQLGEQLGIKSVAVQSVKFALSAFIDETVLTADFPLREEWEKYPLQLEYFGEHLAGVKYFDRLDLMLKDLEENADVIEVYYLCMLLGFKGRYKIYLEDQLVGVIKNVADHLRRANRLKAGALSPHWKVSDQPVPVVDPGLPFWVKAGSAGALLFALLLFFIMKSVLIDSLNSAKEQLLR